MRDAVYLNDIKTLIEITSGEKISQLDFLNRIMPIIPKKIALLGPKHKSKNKSQLSQENLPEKIKANISAMYFKNRKSRKIGAWRYEVLINEIVDSRSGIFKEGVIRQMESGLQAYIDLDIWNQRKSAAQYSVLLNSWKNEKTASVSGEFSRKIEAGEYTPVEILWYMFNITINDSYELNENTYCEILRKLFENYNAKHSRHSLARFIIYSILCSIFPDSNYLNAYKLPVPIRSIEMEEKKKNRRAELFKEHQAVSDIGKIIELHEDVYILGGHGSGKESIVRALEYQHSDWLFFYYKFDYVKREKPRKNLITYENRDEAVETIRHNIDLYDKTVIIVFMNWNGKKDEMYTEVISKIECSKILLTINDGIRDDPLFQSNKIIDINHAYKEDRRKCSEQVFRTISNISIENRFVVSFRNSMCIEECFKRVDYHFYSCIMLAQAIGNSEDFDEFFKKFQKRVSVFAEENVLPYIRNIGLDVSGKLFNVLLLLSLMDGITKSFFHELLGGNSEERNNYESAIRSGEEKSLLYILQNNQNGTSEITYKIFPHVREVVMALPSHDSTSFFHSLLLRVAEKIESLTLGKNSFPDYLREELINLVKAILQNFPYKAGRYTSIYLTYIRFLWIYADAPKTCLDCLLNMESEIQNKHIHLLDSDMESINKTLAYVYGSIGNTEQEEAYLEKVVDTVQKKYISSNALYQLSKIKNSNLPNDNGIRMIETRELVFLENNSSQMMYELTNLKMQLAIMYIQNLKKEEHCKLDASNPVYSYLNDCIIFFQGSQNYVTLATCYYLRGVLRRVTDPSAYEKISSDLNEAEAYRRKFRGEDHTLMLPIYFEQAELAADNQKMEEAAKYLEQIKTIQRKKEKEYKLTEKEMHRLKRIEAVIKESKPFEPALFKCYT